MSVTATPIFPQTIKTPVAQILNATGTGVVAVKAGGTNGTKVLALLAFSSDTSARDIVLSLLVGATTYNIVTISIPANSGNTDVIPCVDLLRHVQFPGLCYDECGNKYFMLDANTTLQVNAAVTITSGKQINVWVPVGGDY